jgi:putative copper export protein
MGAADIVAGTQWGRIWLLQIVAAAIAAGAFVWARHSTRGWFAAAVAATVLAITPALGGHAAASLRFTTLAVLADSLHIVGAAGWLGSLLVLVTVGIPIVTRDEREERWQVIASLVNAFSPAALSFAAMVALTGLVAAWLRVGTFAALWSSSYGQTLLVKLAVLLPLAGTGAYNWRRIRPALGTEGATGTLRRTATIELVVALVVICITSVLVATEPAVG